MVHLTKYKNVFIKITFESRIQVCAVQHANFSVKLRLQTRAFESV